MLEPFKYDTMRDEDITENKYNEYKKQVEVKCPVKYCEHFTQPELCKRFRKEVIELIQK